MVLNHWITKDYYDRVVNVNFAEPDFECINVLLHLADKEALRHLMTAEIVEGWAFQTELYKASYRRSGVLALFVPTYKSYTVYVPTDYFQKIIGEYLEEVQKMDDYFADRSS